VGEFPNVHSKTENQKTNHACTNASLHWEPIKEKSDTREMEDNNIKHPRGEFNRGGTNERRHKNHKRSREENFKMITKTNTIITKEKSNTIHNTEDLGDEGLQHERKNNTRNCVGNMPENRQPRIFEIGRASCRERV
jgi:hypothetical protein